MDDNGLVLDALAFIDPSSCDYQEWIQIGMGLKESGEDCSVWDSWSRQDSKRFHPDECYRKWATFQDSGISGGTIVHLAEERGFIPGHRSIPPEQDYALTWNDTEVSLPQESYRTVKPKFPQWDPVKEVKTYIQTLFEPSDIVGYVVTSYTTDDGKKVPTNGSYNRTAGELLADLDKYKDLGYALGDYDKAAGAWIRFNPLDGGGTKNTNVKDYRYALIESDKDSLDEQYKRIQELNLPCKIVVYSGGKSVHAIVSVDANSEWEYKTRVQKLFEICESAGLHIDKQNKNPSRLSRLPGVERGESKQYIVATDIGATDWDEWQEWVMDQTDDLPDVTSLESFIDTEIVLAPQLISGVLREGHKMMIAGPSKAGKSFALIELAAAIAEGGSWMGHECRQGAVLYVNLEVDAKSCMKRIQDIYKALEIKPTKTSIKNLDIWNLRGKSRSFDKLVDRLIKRIQKRDYSAVIIDPIYKIITGDENSAEQMGKFCSMFDKVCTQTGVACIYCHHFSKGAQGGKKSMDRASGSGVFARDPDALIAMTQLPLDYDVLKCEADDWTLNFLRLQLAAAGIDIETIPEDDRDEPGYLFTTLSRAMDRGEFQRLKKELEEGKQAILGRTAWRLDYTLREFKEPFPKDIYFQYPVHFVDEEGRLKGINPEGSAESNAEKGRAKFKETTEEKYRRYTTDFLQAMDVVQTDGEKPMYKDVFDYLGWPESRLKKVMAESGYRRFMGRIVQKPDDVKR